MKWNQFSIHEWGVKTFGRTALSPMGVAIRMAKESVELSAYMAREEDFPEEVMMEAADVYIVLVQLCNILKIDLRSMMRDKLVQADIRDIDKIIDNEYDAAEVINTETINIISAIHHSNHKIARGHCIRLGAALRCVEDLYDFDLMPKVQEKMEINAARQWGKAKDGSYQHV